MHKSFICLLLESGEIIPFAQREYAKLLRGEMCLAQHARQAVRVADWYIEITDAGPGQVVNETYSVLQFDEQGVVDWTRCRVGRGRNHALYEALRNSQYDDPDDDTAVKKLRAETCDEVAWLPNGEERDRLQRLLETR